jgi:hypothetical protein
MTCQGATSAVLDGRRGCAPVSAREGQRQGGRRAPGRHRSARPRRPASASGRADPTSAQGATISGILSLGPEPGRAKEGHRPRRAARHGGLSLEQAVGRAMPPAPPTEALYSRRERDDEQRERREERRRGPTAEGAKRSDGGARLRDRGRSGPDAATNVATWASARDGVNGRPKASLAPRRGAGGGRIESSAWAGGLSRPLAHQSRRSGGNQDQPPARREERRAGPTSNARRQPSRSDERSTGGGTPRQPLESSPSPRPPGGRARPPQRGAGGRTGTRGGTGPALARTGRERAVCWRPGRLQGTGQARTTGQKDASKEQGAKCWTGPGGAPRCKAGRAEASHRQRKARPLVLASASGLANPTRVQTATKPRTSGRDRRDPCPGRLGRLRLPRRAGRKQGACLARPTRQEAPARSMQRRAGRRTGGRAGDARARPSHGRQRAPWRRPGPRPRQVSGASGPSAATEVQTATLGTRLRGPSNLGDLATQARDGAAFQPGRRNLQAEGLARALLTRP